MSGIMQISTATVTGPGVADLPVMPDPIPDFGWTHRYEAYAAGGNVGGEVAQLRDLIGTSHLQLNGVPGQSGATAPTLIEDADGRYVLLFDAATERLSGVHSPTVGSPFTYVLVFRPLTLPSSGLGIVLGAATADQGTVFIDATTVRVNGGSSIGANPRPPAGKVCIATIVVNGANSSISMSNGGSNTGNAGNGNPASVCIGAGSDGAPSNPLHMQFVAAYITPTALNATQRTQMEAALRTIHRVA